MRPVIPHAGVVPKGVAKEQRTTGVSTNDGPDVDVDRSRTVDPKRNVSCNTIPNWERRDCWVTCRRSWPSIVIAPDQTSEKRISRFTIEHLPVTYHPGTTKRGRHWPEGRRADRDTDRGAERAGP
jgi:hypothetical protein